MMETITPPMETTEMTPTPTPTPMMTPISSSTKRKTTTIQGLMSMNPRQRALSWSGQDGQLFPNRKSSLLQKTSPSNSSTEAAIETITPPHITTRPNLETKKPIKAEETKKRSSLRTNGDVLKEGVLLQQSKKKLEKYWVILNDSTLSVFKDKGLKDQKVCLKFADIEKVQVGYSDKNQFMFMISKKGESAVECFFTSSLTIRDEWIADINKAVLEYQTQITHSLPSKHPPPNSSFPSTPSHANTSTSIMNACMPASCSSPNHPSKFNRNTEEEQQPEQTEQQQNEENSAPMLTNSPVNCLVQESVKGNSWSASKPVTGDRKSLHLLGTNTDLAMLRYRISLTDESNSNSKTNSSH